MTHEVLSIVPVPVLGIDASGMIAISNAAADQLLGEGASMVGEHASDVLPAELTQMLEQDRSADVHALRIGGAAYEVRCTDLGAASRGTGTLVTLLRGGAA